MSRDEELLEFLYTTPIGIARTAPDGTVLFMNPLLANLLMVLCDERPRSGTRHPVDQEIKTENLLDFFSIYDKPFKEVVARKLQGENKRILENHDIPTGGNRIKFIRVSCVKLSGGDLSFVVQDISEQRRAEELARIRLELVDFAHSHSIHALLQKTLDEIGAETESPIGFFHFVEADQKTLSLQAWSTRTEKEFCRIPGKGMHYSMDRAGVWVDCARTGKPTIHNDYQMLPHRKGLPEGHPPIIRELVVPVIREGRVAAILGVGNKPRPYTEDDQAFVAFVADVAWERVRRRQAEESLKTALNNLQRQRELLKRALDAAGEGILYADTAFQVQMANAVLLKMIGADGESMEGKKCYDLLSNALCETDGCPLRRILNGEEKVETETRLRSPQETDIPVAVTARPVKDRAGNIVGMVESLRDLREIRKSEERTRKETELRALAEGYARMSAMVLHNMGNILTPMTISMETMRGDDAETTLGLLVKCHRELAEGGADPVCHLREDDRGGQVFRYMGKLIDSLQRTERRRANNLDILSSGLSRISDIITRQQHFSISGDEAKEPLDLSVEMENSLTILSFRLREHGVVVTRELAGDLPRVMMEPRHLRFLTNALVGMSMAPGGEGAPGSEKRMRVRTFPHQDGAGMEARYHGCGPSSNHQGTDPADLSGPGLHYSRKIAETDGGTFILKRRKDAGETIIRVLFSRAKGQVYV